MYPGQFSGPECGIVPVELKFERALSDLKSRARRLRAAGVTRAVLSVTAYGLQSVKHTGPAAAALARRVNDWLAQAIADSDPELFSAFAVLPMRQPTAALKELQRCVTKHGFVGALVNSYDDSGRCDNGNRHIYYDTPAYLPFWQGVADLEVPLYLHPRPLGPSPHGSRDESTLSKVFDPFFTTKGVNRGLGLGLSISYNILKDFGGNLRAENLPDGGAAFTMTLAKAETKPEIAP